MGHMVTHYNTWSYNTPLPTKPSTCWSIPWTPFARNPARSSYGINTTWVGSYGINTYRGSFVRRAIQSTHVSPVERRISRNSAFPLYLAHSDRAVTFGTQKSCCRSSRGTPSKFKNIATLKIMLALKSLGTIGIRQNCLRLRAWTGHNGCEGSCPCPEGNASFVQQGWFLGTQNY